MGMYKFLTEREAIAALGEWEYFFGPGHEGAILVSVPAECSCTDLNRFLALVARTYGWGSADFEFKKIDPEFGAVLDVFEYRKVD